MIYHAISCLRTLIFITLFISCHSWSVQQYNQQGLAVTCNITTSFCRQPNLTQYGDYSGIARSGYLKLSKNGSALAFSFFGPKGVTDLAKLKKIPIVLVLGGGPGASSQFNSLEQIGPYRLRRVFVIKVVENNDTWAKDYSLLFIDQPVGTGVSCLNTASHLVTSMEGVIDDLYQAVNELFTPDGCLTALGIPPSIPLFLFGESYGGKYAPAFGMRLLNEMKKKGKVTGLKGVLIGDGFTAPYKILSQLGNHAFSLGLLDYQQRMRIEKILLRSNIHYETKDWLKLQQDFWQAIKKIEQYTGLSVHDIKKDYTPTPDLISEFFSNSSKLEQFGFEKSIPFKFLNNEVYQKMINDYMKDQLENVEKLLAAKIPLLVFHGQDDLIVSASGAMKWVDQLKFSHSKQFRAKKFSPFKINNDMMGSTKSAGKLTFTVINNAGHFAAGDASKAVYTMAKQFISSNS